ncbi:MAG: xanthine dehydrogenase [Rhodobacteraceae bacterium CG17_big_fil_post_rev_8_21_14_2_50_63_15]|nr:xanthine dehydrogenase family protein subunit M [Roseovarius sp.]PIV78065.1 MAG: xanthine dehydrogenase [Rhodobacteraceae bacterium CG17_big_fil_post_rev_8_21_14_2_50_63_15]
MKAYHRPTTVQDALDVLSGGPARIVAGCTDLFPATGARELQGQVVDITAIADLRGVMRASGGWRIGAATRWVDVMRADLPAAFHMLQQAAREVGSVQIQNTATVAGNLCNASPAADGVPCLLALDAVVEIGSAAGVRRVAIGDFITGIRQTVLRPGEMVLAVHVPDAAARGRSRFLKLGARRYLVISIAMVAVRLEIESGGITRAAVAVGACSAVARRMVRLEAVLEGARLEDAANRVEASLVLPDLAPIDDIRADASYRGVAALELIRRAVIDLVQT